MGGWTWPMCVDCWNERNPTKMAAQIIKSPIEICCECGKETQSGIYIRRNPNEVKFKKPTDE